MKKNKNINQHGSLKDELKNHKWLCTPKVCLNTLKELEKTFINSGNIWRWEKQLEQCNSCYLEKKNHSVLNSTTRWTVSTEVHFYKSQRS